MFKSSKVYIQIWRDKVKVTDLNSGIQVIRKAEHSFSSERQVVSDFNNADATVRAALKESGISGFFTKPKMVIQQMEGIEGVLSQVEKRGLQDLAEIAGAGKVFLIDHDRELSLNEAFELVK